MRLENSQHNLNIHYVIGLFVYYFYPQNQKCSIKNPNHFIDGKTVT